MLENVIFIWQFGSHRLESVCNAWKIQPTDWTIMPLLWFILILIVKKVIGHLQQKSPWLYSCFYRCGIALWRSFQMGNVTTMGVNTDWNTDMSIFMDLKRLLNCLKTKITKIEENLNETVKHSLKKCTQISYKKNLNELLSRASAIGRSVLEGNVNWDPTIMCAMERYPL